MRTDRSFQTKKTSPQNPNILCDFFFNSTVELIFAIFYVGGHDYTYIWLFPKIVVPQNGWFRMEIPINMDDLGVALFLETPIYI